MITVLHGDVSGCNVGNHLRDEERIVLRALVFVKSIISCFFLEGMKSTYTGGNNDTYSILVDTFRIKIGISHSLLSGHKGILRIEVKLTQLLTVKMVSAIEVLDFASELSLELGSIKMSDRAGAANTIQGVGPCGRNIIAQGGDSTQACNYNSL